LGNRVAYEVRIREQVAPNKWVKKSRIYLAKSPKDAARRYKGKGLIMSVEKVTRERLFGTGSFFNLGDSLLKELKKEVRGERKETTDGC